MYYPKITVITITYNSEKTLRDTFESVRKQSYSNLEYLVIDGGSKDSTLSIISDYSDIITNYISEPDGGISDAMNKGIRMSSGELISIIYSDDVLADGALMKVANVWNGMTDVYYGHALIIDEDGKPLHVLRAQKDLRGMQYQFLMVHQSTFVTSKAYEKFGLYDLKYKCAMDYELFLRFYKLGASFCYIDDVLAQYRVGGTNMKLRQKTIDEVRGISIAYGGNMKKANLLRLNKMVKDRFRPIISKLHISSTRVKKYENYSDD